MTEELDMEVHDRLHDTHAWEVMNALHTVLNDDVFWSIYKNIRKNGHLDSNTKRPLVG